jgi:hypothetical protein
MHEHYREAILAQMSQMMGIQLSWITWRDQDWRSRDICEYRACGRGPLITWNLDSVSTLDAGFFASGLSQ